MDFSDALRLVKAGKKVARSGWNGKGMYIALQAGSTITAAQARGGVAKALADEGVEQMDILPHIDMKGADGRVTCGWAPSQPDMLAEDWGEV